MQFWFCPRKFQACIKDSRSRSIVHFPALPLVWPIMSGTNLTQAEVAEFEASGFSFSTGEKNLSSVHPGLPLEESLSNNDPISLSAPVGIEPVVLVPVCSQIVSDGDKRSKHRSGKLFRFVPLPSSDHLLKMESSKVIDCTVLKSMLVPEPGYGVVFILHTPGSILKELYEVTVSNFPACTYRGFRYMCTSALGNPTKKWILCKHLYFILQNRMFCTVDDVFIHCPSWTTNKVRLLMSKMESRK